MTSVKTYLDANFRSPGDLRENLDAESTRLKKREEDISQQIQVEQESAQQSRLETLRELGEYFKGLSSTILEGVPSDRDLREKLAELDEDSPVRVASRAKFRNLQTWAKGYQVVLRLKRLAEGKDQMSELLGKDDEEGTIELFTKLLEEERVLKGYSKSSTPVISCLAQKGLDEFDANFRSVLQAKFKSELEEFLHKSNWPKEGAPKEDQTFIRLLRNMLVTEPILDTSDKTPQALRAFKILTQPLDIRFQFHFEGDRETNRLDKPEWAFNHFITVVDENYDMLISSAQTALSGIQRFEGRNGVHEFITALLGSIYRKLSKDFPQTLETPQLLSHLVYECVNFDNQLKERYFYSTYGNDDWRGVTGDMLAKQDWFEKWLQVEKESSFSRYKEIIESPTAFNIDWEAVEPNETKPTSSAINLKDLLEGITEHYSNLHSVNYRLRFLLGIQIDLIDKYYDKLHDSINAFDSMSSSLVRAVGGMSAESTKLVTGINGLERLCRLFGSLEYIASALETWGQDLFFLELWDDISKLSKRNKSLDSKVSQAVGDSSATIPEDENDDGTLFDETVASYNKLKYRVTLTISSVLKKELQQSMQDYFKTSYWRTDAKPEEISPKLIQPIKILSKELGFLRSFHTKNDFTSLTRSFSADLSRYIWNYIIQSNQFSENGALQLSNDVTQIWTSLFLPRDGSLRKVEQALAILKLPRGSQSLDPASVKEDLALSDLSLDDIRGIAKRIY